jgi:predicted  nucleic acid-binding Zn-ribbon protein
MSKEVSFEDVSKELKKEKNKRKRMEAKVRELQKKLRNMEKDKILFNQRIDRLTKENIMLKEKIEGPVGRIFMIYL